MVFNEIISDLRALSIQYENKINRLYALFVSLERVNMRYIEKMKSRSNSPQTSSQQLKARIQICKNMKQVLTNTKMYENLLTDQQKNLLPKSYDIDPFKPCSENLNELTNPYFKQSPTKPAPISDLLTKYECTSEVDNPTKMSSAAATTSITKVTLPQTEDMVQSPNEYATSVTSTKLKKLHPWCKSTRTKEEIKDRFTERTFPTKELTRSTMQSTKPSKEVLISSNSTTMEHSEHNEIDQLETSSDAALSDNIQENVTSKNKTNIKYTKQEIHDLAIFKKESLSSAQHVEAYPWEKEAAKNRDKDSPLLEKVIKLTEGVYKLLPTERRSQLFENIQYPDCIMKKIEAKIDKQGRSNFVCINYTSSPSFSQNRRRALVRHIKIELGYYMFRCSFCDDKSNNSCTLINHYASTHGIPSTWLKSN